MVSHLIKFIPYKSQVMIKIFLASDRKRFTLLQNLIKMHSELKIYKYTDTIIDKLIVIAQLSYLYLLQMQNIFTSSITFSITL